ncbi:PAS domain-containing sensor histidine kinase [Streptomyces sp. NBC_01231]|nr:PAS domain-containing sensor histidine kinase [Streptomyces sp. NBC_01231]
MRMPLRDRIALAAALLAPLVIALVLVPFRTHMTSANLALILVVVVVAVAALGSRAAGVLAALSAAAWFDFFLTHPYQRFTISHGDDITTTLLLLAVGVAVSQLSARARTLKLVTVTDAAHLARIHDTASLVQAGASPYAVVDQVRQQLVEILGLRSCRFEHGTLLGRHPRLDQDGSVTAGRVPWDLEKDGWPGEEIELRAQVGGRYLGRFMLLPEPGAAPPSLQTRLVAVSLADHVGAALDTAGPVLDR